MPLNLSKTKKSLALSVSFFLTLSTFPTPSNFKIVSFETLAPLTQASLLSTSIELIEESIIVRYVTDKSVSTARLEKEKYLQDRQNERIVRGVLDRYRGSNWFDAFYTGHEIFYLISPTNLFEFRVVTSDVKGILDGDPLFEHADRRVPVNSSVRLKQYTMTPPRKLLLEKLLSSKGHQVHRENAHVLLKKSNLIKRESLPIPLQSLAIEEARNLGDGIHAYFPVKKDSKNKVIYFHDVDTGLALVLEHGKDRIVSGPIYTLKSPNDYLRYAQFLYNVLAKVHNATGRTPKVWDPVLMQMRREVASSEESILKDKEFPTDLEELVQLIHKKRKTAPPPMEKLEFITKPQSKVHNVAFVYDGNESLTLPLLGRLKESPNLAPVMIIGNDPKKGITPYAIWRNLIHGDYEEIYPDSGWEEWEEKWNEKKKVKNTVKKIVDGVETEEEIEEDIEVEVKSGFFGYVFLNGKKVWVFKNLEQMKLLKKAGKLPEEVVNTKMDLLLGAKIPIRVSETTRKEIDSDFGRALSGYYDKTGEEPKWVPGILNLKTPIQTCSQVQLFERPGPYRMVVDPLFNAGKVNPDVDLHFKAPHTGPRLLARLVNGIYKTPGLTLNNIRSIRLDSQLFQAPPLDKSTDVGQQNAMVPFTNNDNERWLNQFNDLFTDFNLDANLEGKKPNIDHAQGKHLSEKTSSLFEVVLEINKQPSEKDVKLTEKDVVKFLRTLSEGYLKDYLFVHEKSIQGKHVRKQPGVHISVEEGITVIPIKGGENNYKVGFKFWFDRDWEEAGELIRLADTVGWKGVMQEEMPQGTPLEARRDVLRDFLFDRNTITPERRVFPYVEFAPEPAAGVLEASTGRIGRTALYALSDNLPSVQSNVFLPEYRVGNFNVRFVAVVGPSSIADAVIPILADGTYGKWDADVEFGQLDRNDPRYKVADFENVLGWFTINGSERIYLIRGKEKGSDKFLKREEIAYDTVIPLADLTPSQKEHFFLFAASGDKADDAGLAMKNPEVKKVLIPQPWKKVKKGDGKITFVYHASAVRQMWPKGKTFSPGSCTTNCAVFAHLLNELLFNLNETKAGGLESLNRRVQRSIGKYFENVWDDFPKEWRTNPDQPLEFTLFPGESETHHSKTNSQPTRNQENRALNEEDEGKPVDIDPKYLDSQGMNDSPSGITKALAQLLPRVKAINTRSLRVNHDTGSRYINLQDVAVDNVKPYLGEAELQASGFKTQAEYHKALESYFKKKMLKTFAYAARYLFQGSLRISLKHELQNAHLTRRDSATSIFEENKFRLNLEPTKKEVRFQFKEVLWYDNEWGFTVQVLGLLSELALAMGEEAIKSDGGFSPINWLVEQSI